MIEILNIVIITHDRIQHQTKQFRIFIGTATQFTQTMAEHSNDQHVNNNRVKLVSGRDFDTSVEKLINLCEHKQIWIKPRTKVQTILLPNEKICVYNRTEGVSIDFKKYLPIERRALSRPRAMPKLQPVNMFTKENIIFLDKFLDPVFKHEVFESEQCKRKHHRRRLFRYLEKKISSDISKEGQLKVLLICAEFILRSFEECKSEGQADGVGIFQAQKQFNKLRSNFPIYEYATCDDFYFIQGKISLASALLFEFLHRNNKGIFDCKMWLVIPYDNARTFENLKDGKRYHESQKQLA